MGKGGAQTMNKLMGNMMAREITAKKKLRRLKG